MAATRKTIRFEDLGEPVQRLLKSIKGGVSDEEMALLEFVSVKDMAKIYSEMSTDRQAEQIWAELRNALEARRRKAELKRLEMEGREQELAEARRAAEEEEQRAAEEEAARLAAEEEAEARRKRKEEKRRRKAEERAAAAEAEEEAARLAAEEEAARLAAEEEEAARLAAEEEDRRRREKKKKKREARLRQLEAEEAALREERERARSERSTRRAQKDEWEDYVNSHPLEFAPVEVQEIEQVKVERDTKPPPSATEALLNRSYTPKCPNCAAKFSKPPPEWDCPMCLRRLRKRFKVWQPDEDSEVCMLCKVGIGRFSRHHCRNCGRLTCGACLTGRALIAPLGYKDTPVKVCADCVTNIPEDERHAAEAAARGGSASPEHATP